MKVVIFILAGFMTAGLNSCEKQTNLTGQFQAKYVAGLCGQDIIQVLDTAYFEKGMNWTNRAGESFTHVFTVANHCEFAASGIKVGETFTCVLVDSSSSNSCAVCKAYMETPPKSWNIKVTR
ncbi:MAG: hypothetical protein QM725_01775 [Lacibacter sp.]